MTTTRLTFDESYGHLSRRAVHLIRKFNVSPADYDGILMSLGLRWQDAEHFIPETWVDIEDFIVSHSKTGMYNAPLAW